MDKQGLFAGLLNYSSIMKNYIAELIVDFKYSIGKNEIDDLVKTISKLDQPEY